MKATAIALLLVSTYDIVRGLSILRYDTTKGVVMVVLGILLIPLAWYLWGKNLGGRGSAK